VKEWMNQKNSVIQEKNIEIFAPGKQCFLKYLFFTAGELSKMGSTPSFCHNF
jgi:hypothetical protein